MNSIIDLTSSSLGSKTKSPSVESPAAPHPDRALSPPGTRDTAPPRFHQKRQPPLKRLLSEYTPPTPPYWMERWPEIEAHIMARPRLLLAVGFDRMLSPTAGRADEITEGIRSLLAKFRASSRTNLAFISGRPLREIRTHVGLEGVFYAGNHGMEVRGPGLVSYDGLAVSCRSDLVDALVLLKKCTKRLQGVLVEDRSLTVSVYWQQSDSCEGTAVRELMEVIVKNHPQLTVVSRPGMWEVRPRTAWNKSHAIQQILANLHLTPADTIYIGDEFTDEDSFALLPSGLTFCIRTTLKTAARYRFHDPSEIGAFLFCLLCSVNGVRLA
ncbi:MAG: otsB [Chthoniobacteraceae bacterium]|nr:otsB [Chthoniobacteraceae bacterium]